MRRTGLNGEARLRALALAGLLPPIARFVVRGAIDEMTDEDIARSAMVFEVLARWVHSEQRQPTEATE